MHIWSMSNFLVSEIKISNDAIYFAILDWSRVSCSSHCHFIMTCWSESWNVPGKGIVYGSIVSVVLLKVIVVKWWVIPFSMNVSVEYFDRFGYNAFKFHSGICSFLDGCWSNMRRGTIELESTYIVRTLSESCNSRVSYRSLDALNETLDQICCEEVLRSKQVNLYLISCWSKVCTKEHEKCMSYSLVGFHNSKI